MCGDAWRIPGRVDVAGPLFDNLGMRGAKADQASRGGKPGVDVAPPARRISAVEASRIGVSASGTNGRSERQRLINRVEPVVRATRRMSVEDQTRKWRPITESPVDPKTTDIDPVVQN
jgi:hypothetical protein